MSRRTKLLAAAGRRRKATYYVSTTGNDANSGTSPLSPWQTIAKVNATTLAAGDVVLFNRGQTFSGGLVCDNSGTSPERVVFGAYGVGSSPVISGSGTGVDPVTVNSNYVTLQDLQATTSGASSYPVGIRVYGTDCVVQRCVSTANAAGIAVEPGAHRAKALYNNVFDNDIVVAPPGPDDDFGAFGIVLAAADDCEVAYNTITGHIGSSPDYGSDGTAIEIFGSIRANIHHNTCVDNFGFTEIGDIRSADNVFHHNLIVSSIGPPSCIAFNLQGTGTFGPVLNTSIHHNTVVHTGPESIGLIVGANATVSLHNNVMQVTYAGATGGQKVDEGHNVFTGDAADLWSSANSGSGIASTSVANADPGFIGTDDYRLAPSSPAINRGISLGYTVDFNGDPRTFAGTPDAGAYEFDGSIITTNLSDPFTAFDPAKWTLQPGAEVTAGRLSVPCTTAYQGATSVPQQNLTNKSVLVELVQIPAIGTGTTETFFSVGPSGTHNVRFIIGNGQIQAARVVAGTVTTQATATYNTTNHRWLRISESGGTITWWTSANGTTWTSFTTWALGGAFSVTACELVLFAGYWGTETSPGPALFDNLNQPPG